MRVNQKYYETIWLEGSEVKMIEQNLLPFEFCIYSAKTCSETCHAIRTMILRGAGAIGAAAAFAMAQAAIEADSISYFSDIKKARLEIESTRPTARNLFDATEKVYQAALSGKESAVDAAIQYALKDKKDSKKIGELGNALISDNFRILTHCNAGWLAFVDHGTALSPIYTARDCGKRIFVWVDETRPRSQGAKLTAWELQNENIPFKIIPDNAGAYLMSKGLVDLVIVGADRIARNGDTANKIGTLEKAIAAKYYGIPFYVAAPLSTFDGNSENGKNIIVEERIMDEVLYQEGITMEGKKEKILVSNPGSEAINPAFDITPGELISGIITEKGIIKANMEEISRILIT
ncbi:MAG: S-methyl-5-thioribose-1-phosphate isomerase [Bacteroidales bacterium]